MPDCDAIINAIEQRVEADVNRTLEKLDNELQQAEQNNDQQEIKRIRDAISRTVQRLARKYGPAGLGAFAGPAMALGEAIGGAVGAQLDAVANQLWNNGTDRAYQHLCLADQDTLPAGLVPQGYRCSYLLLSLVEGDQGEPNYRFSVRFHPGESALDVQGPGLGVAGRTIVLRMERRQSDLRLASYTIDDACSPLTPRNDPDPPKLCLKRKCYSTTINNQERGQIVWVAYVYSYQRCEQQTGMRRERRETIG